ncbi:hypothetical protein I8748_30460 [Nostoc sp. CENA67]|uniref:Uncharacterized protein n=1 Tax=Amazonocrinis nigriterrae CENA67 TaxID=2794033 RepID=A0A8J7LC61_9NOST|nr:hypothetical protein [Amazonocrinis nigriterrae]MBH8566425.1 hypothetical protein [Amazonocrinis nigriterrae CENA67]
MFNMFDLFDKENQDQCRNILNSLQKDINELLQKVDDKFNEIVVSLSQGNNIKLADINYLNNSEIQEELAKQIALLQRLFEYIAKIQKKKRKNLAECVILQSKVNSAKVALSFLLIGKTRKIIFAKNIRYSIEYYLNRRSSWGFINNFFQQAVREWSAPTKVLLGLAMALPIYTIAVPGSLFVAGLLTIATHVDFKTPLPSSNVPQIQNRVEKPQPTETQLFFQRYTMVLVSALAGTFGSIISILLRLKQYRESAYKGLAAPILVGFAKPLIGTAFGILVFTIISSNIISTIQVPKASQEADKTDIEYYFFFSIAFVVGFSERLADDIIQRAESTFLPETANKLKEAGEEFQSSAKDIHAAGEEFQSSAKDIQLAAEDLKQTAANESSQTNK